MPQFTRLHVFAVAIFCVCMLVSQLYVANHFSVKSPSQPRSQVKSPKVATVDAAVARDVAVSANKPASASISNSQIQQVSYTEAESEADDTAVRRAIKRHFPDLSSNVLDGWVDTYRGVPLDELNTMLTEKKQMSALLSDFMTHQTPRAEMNVPQEFSLSELNSLVKKTSEPGFVESESVEVEPAMSPAILDAISRLQKNLLHATTPGFRRTVVRTTVTEISADAESDEMRLSLTHDFTPGEIVTSPSALHLAIKGHPEHWFLLEPGQLLTRQGAFERLADGRIGLMDGDRIFQLAGDVAIPETASNLNVDHTGVVTCRDADGNQKSVGQIKLAVVNDLTQLVSSNGVYFTRTGDAENVEMAAPAYLETESIEASNVNPASEEQYLKHFERLGSFPVK